MDINVMTVIMKARVMFSHGTHARATPASHRGLNMTVQCKQADIVQVTGAGYKVVIVFLH